MRQFSFRRVGGPVLVHFKGVFYRRLTSIWLLLSALLVGLPGLTPSAQASAFYLETTGGLSKVAGSSGFFPGLSGGSSLGVGIQGSLMYQWGYENAFFALDIGLQTRMSHTTSTNPDGAYGLWSVYPALRIQTGMVFVGAGYTTYNWQRISTTQGYDNFQALTGSKSMFAEAGVLFPITPMFSIGGSAGYTMAQASTGSASILDLGFLLRFYFTPLGLTHKTLEWDGWRYPRGYWEGH